MKTSVGVAAFGHSFKQKRRKILVTPDDVQSTAATKLVHTERSWTGKIISARPFDCRFVGLDISESMSDHLSFWRFRQALEKRALMKTLLGEIKPSLPIKVCTSSPDRSAFPMGYYDLTQVFSAMRFFHLQKTAFYFVALQPSAQCARRQLGSRVSRFFIVPAPWAAP